uniref:Alpha/beta hydrolase fold-3 domain-containing protein n=1 Tax=Hemiselmis andersenii TaxID=464988 RepID=A0A7S1GWY4_HEMAN|mmetsp:Transcript_23632/g.57365  ORF Transcript_23632/g.57365 Transcript_23632/m.57365 type:complete len:417 (+) Transcript_23632:339-1589(+)
MSSAMGGNTEGEMSQEAAAAAWRAARTQKSCLHSGKPEGDSESSKATPSTGWGPMEATWRAGTLPFRLAHNTLALNWKARTRPTWNKQLDQAVVSLKTCYCNTPLNASLIRYIADRSVPASLIPDNVGRVSQDLGGDLKVAWTFPGALKHHADAERFILYVHSPFYTSSGSSIRGLTSRLALACTAAVLTVDYRSPPEEERESAVQDLIKAYRWLLTQPAVTPANVIVMADGLGAALALNVLADLRASEAAAGHADSSLPVGCAFMSPWVSLADASPSWDKHGATDFLHRRVCDFVAAGYAGLSDPSDPPASPAAGDLAGLPSTFVSVGACEVLYDQAAAFARRLGGAGVQVELDEGEEMPHAFQLFAGMAPACEAGILRIAAFTRRVAPGHLAINAQSDALMGLQSDAFGGDDRW